MRVIIIGCGRVGARTAAELDQRGDHVTVIDVDQRAFNRLPSTFGGITVRGSGSDEDILAWVHARGTERTDEECHVWNRFIAKLGWRDERSHVLPQRIQESGLTGKTIETLIDHIEFDEGRDPVTERAWEKI